MKQLFIALVLINLLLPLFLGDDQVEAGIADESVKTDNLSKNAASPEFIAAASLPVLAQAKSAEVSSDQHNAADAPAITVANTESPNPVSTKPRAVEATAPSVAAAAKRPEGNGSCVIAGPFRKKSAAEELVKLLAAKEVKSELQPRDTSVLPDYMVYVGPAASIGKAREMAAEFAARNIDSHVIASGSLRNALSLGVFSRGPLADDLRLKLEKEGHRASIAKIVRNRRGFQVRTSLPSAIRSQLVSADTPMVDCPAGAPSALAAAGT